MCRSRFYEQCIYFVFLWNSFRPVKLVSTAANVKCEHASKLINEGLWQEDSGLAGSIALAPPPLPMDGDDGDDWPVFRDNSRSNDTKTLKEDSISPPKQTPLAQYFDLLI